MRSRASMLSSITDTACTGKGAHVSALGGHSSAASSSKPEVPEVQAMVVIRLTGKPCGVLRQQHQEATQRLTTRSQVPAPKQASTPGSLLGFLKSSLIFNM